MRQAGDGAAARRAAALAPRVGVQLLALLLAAASPAEAYIGPGAGFALVSSFLVLFTTLAVAALTLLVWPVRGLWRLLTRRPRGRPSIRRLLIVGFDGQDPRITERLLAEGKLPNLEALRNRGCYHTLRTTCPALSPVAWSSFATGTEPASHNIFDFLDRDRRSYLPLLSSTRIGPAPRSLKLGPFRIPLGKPELRLLRKSKPLWSILGEQNIWSTVLRVPITFPPDRFYGAQLSAMCVPDLMGTQGTFQLFTTRGTGERFKEGGVRVAWRREGDRYEARLRGPENSLLEGSPPVELPLVARVDRARRQVRLELASRRLLLKPGELSDWVPLKFKAAPGIKVSGLVRLMVTELDDEHFSLYATPLSIDPDKPAMPISHPAYYAPYLAKRIGHFCTLGLAEDTWALNEGVLTDAAFLRQTYDIDAERQAMLFAALDRLRRGALVCVLDATDRIQHMFWRYLEAHHPARERAASPEVDERSRSAIEDIYVHNDRLVGRLMERLRSDDVLMVISDHGFSSFRRGFNLNAWLEKEGYLVRKAGADGTAEWLRDVDWSRTRAYALGLTGLYLNLRGREEHGIVEPGEPARALREELGRRLSGLLDPERGEVAINRAFDTARIYHGPYKANAPDLIPGYNAGYRISWDGATGVLAGPIFEDNTKPWSGDHCIDPELVPGIFFCNRPIDERDPGLLDIAPTALRLFGLEPPPYMAGKPLFHAAPPVGAKGSQARPAA